MILSTLPISVVVRWNCPICREEITGMGWRHRRSKHPEAHSKIVFGTVLLLTGGAVLNLSILLGSRLAYPLLFAFVAIAAVAAMWGSVVLLFRAAREARAILEPVSRD